MRDVYRLPKPDGTYLEGVTVRDGYVYGPSGKKLGKTKMFPDLQTADGKRVTQPTVAPQTGDDGQALDDVTPVEPPTDPAPTETPETPAPGAGRRYRYRRSKENKNGIKQKA